MVSSQTQCNLKNAEGYFKEHLSVGDYYGEGERVRGQWMGKGAEELQLRGVVQEQDFLNLCRNVNPRTGEQLTVRQNSTRIENQREVANRRVFYDFTFSPPKSVSIAALVASDQRILEAHNRAVRVAVNELEEFGATRVRKNGVHDLRMTGNFVCAAFQHQT